MLAFHEDEFLEHQTQDFLLKRPYLQWCGESKCVKQTNKPAIDMVKMQKLLEDLVEAAQEDHHILRFKSLKNTSTEIKHQQICPFLPGEQHLGDSQPPLSQLDLAHHSSQGETAQSEGEPLGHFIGQILEAAGRQDVKSRGSEGHAFWP